MTLHWDSGIHVMIDLETLALSPDAVILQIGAVKFDRESIHGTFEATLDWRRQARLFERRIDPDVMRWWESQPQRDRVLNGERYLYDALADFRDWYGLHSLPTWGNGAAFDLAILQDAFHGAGKLVFWSHKHERCYRTVRLLLGLPKAVSATAHTAVSDALAQARVLQEAMQQ